MALKKVAPFSNGSIYFYQKLMKYSGLPGASFTTLCVNFDAEMASELEKNTLTARPRDAYVN